MTVATESDEHCSLDCQFLSMNKDFSDDARCVLFEEVLYGSLVGNETDPRWRRVKHCVAQERKP